MARKSLLHAIKLKLDIDKESRIVLLRDNQESRLRNINPRHREETKNHSRKYCPRQAYNLAITLCLSIERGEYAGVFEITSPVLEKIREYEKASEKPNFETCIR